jgi:hypothetical protein
MTKEVQWWMVTVAARERALPKFAGRRRVVGAAQRAASRR